MTITVGLLLLLSAEGNDFSFGGDIVPWVEMASYDFALLLFRTLTVDQRNHVCHVRIRDQLDE
ncbi:hypothetical protein ACC676_38720, partial [Rhizobium ruizarguesonis]